METKMKREENGGTPFDEPTVRQFSQDGYAIVENRTAALPITLGFELTTWEAERSLKELRSKVGSEFFQEIQIVRAKLNFSLPNARDDRQLPGHTVQSQNQPPTG